MPIRGFCRIALAGLMIAGLGPHTASAAKLSSVVRGVLLPEEAQRYEDLARQHRRGEEERYWRDYRTGLEERRRESGIGREEARRYQEQAHRNRHVEEEHYWRDYGSGMERPGFRR